MSTTLVDQCIVDWYESQSEETLCDLRDRFDADTPRKAWIAFFADCPTLATKQPGESLAAPAAAGQGSGTHSYLWKQIFFADPIGQWVCTRGHSFRWSIRRWTRNAEQRRA